MPEIKLNHCAGCAGLNLQKVHESLKTRN